MNKIALCIVGDGRLEYLARAVASLREQVAYPFVEMIMVNDSGSAKVDRALRADYPEFTLISHPRRRGTVRAVRSGWAAALRSGADYLFHTEEDFTYNEPIDLDAMAALLDERPALAQVVLKRDPYSPAEHEAGGYMELYPDRYLDTDSPAGPYCEHRLLFSSNPSLITRKVLQLGPFSGEAHFGSRCVRAGYRFAYWGRTTDPPRVTHIGLERSNGWRQ